MSAEAVVTGPAEVAGAPTETTRDNWTFRPNVDILQTDEELTLLIDLPGAQGDAIDVDFRDGALTVHAKVAQRLPKTTNYLLREYGVGDFYRAFNVSEAVDASGITAEFRDGVLTLHLPLAAAVKPHKISVKTE